MGKQNETASEEQLQESASASTAEAQTAADSGTANDAAASDDAGSDDSSALTDRHGNDAIARGKYNRDIAARDKENAELKRKLEELQSKVDDAAKSEQSAKDLRSEIEKLRSEMAEKDVDHALKMAGCRSVKAARALLGDYDGDIAKLAQENPYLFERQKPSGATGAKPSGNATSLDDIDRAMGIRK